MNKELTSLIHHPQRIGWFAIGVIGLAMTYLFQDTFLLSTLVSSNVHPYVDFAAKKIWRVLLNDTFMLLIIYAWFYDKRLTLLAWWIQLIDTLILLPLYLSLKLWSEGTIEISSPLLSQLHRLIINPTLMIIFIPAVYFQRLRAH